jgi:hypothetical protein
MMKKVRLNSAKYKPTRIWKFGVQIPSNFNDAKKLDHENGNFLWVDATCLEMAQLDEYECFEDLVPMEIALLIIRRLNYTEFMIANMICDPTVDALLVVI